MTAIGRYQSPPPDYNQVAQDPQIYTISGTDTSSTPVTGSIYADPALQPPRKPIPVSLAPPSYNSLFGNVRPPVEDTSSAQTDQGTRSAASVPSSQNSSIVENGNVLPATGSNQSTDITQTESPNTCPPNISCLSKYLLEQSSTFKRTLLTIGFSCTLGACTSMLYFGTTNDKCDNSGTLPTMLKASGAGGIVFIAMCMAKSVCCKEGSKDRKHFNIFFVLLPFILTIFFFIGSSSAYTIWKNKRCDPFKYPGCNELMGYCSDALIMFSFIFYVTAMCLLSPLWFLILFGIFYYFHKGVKDCKKR